MKPKDIFLNSLYRKPVPRPSTGSATSVATIDLMKQTECFFPKAHIDPEIMAGLAAGGYTEIGFDNVMPLFSVCHESVAIGCHADWGETGRMPDCRGGIYKMGDEIKIPNDFLKHDSCQVPLKALSLLKSRYGDEVAVLGKVFGPWTLGYHVFGVEEFLISTLTDPDSVKKSMEALKEVTVAFGHAQLDAGADVLCLADHATRDLCSPEAYRDFLSELHCELKERLGCPIVLHICGDTSDRISMIKDTGIECFHFDSKVQSQKARELAGDRMSLMGGTSNFDIIRIGTPEKIADDVREKVANGIDIIGPECAVPLDAPFNNMKILAEEVKKTAWNKTK